MLNSSAVRAAKFCGTSLSNARVNSKYDSSPPRLQAFPNRSPLISVDAPGPFVINFRSDKLYNETLANERGFSFQYTIENNII